MSSTAERESVSLGGRLRRVYFSGDGSLHGVARQHGCELSAIAQLVPFVVDDSFITVLTSAGRVLRSAELITAMDAAFVRRPGVQEVLLGFQLGRPRHSVYIDEALLAHKEVLFCIEPPTGYATAPPEALRAELGARLISLPGNPAPLAPDRDPISVESDARSEAVTS